MPCPQDMDSCELFSGKNVNDPIHGFVYLNPDVLSFIDTPQFQRLRGLRQLAASYLVYPGAVHTRFEHSLGVYHLADKMMESISYAQPSLKVEDRHFKYIRLAGLLHDLGHGPFSHCFDHLFIGTIRPERKWAHEEGSCRMLEFLLEQNP
ncbi:deoxynucleoside triphosphate triphosphohydrolase SAMHD1-like, partial [Aduncisulcus paluster]